MNNFNESALASYVKSKLNVYNDWPKPGINYLNTVDICRDPDLFWNTVMWYYKLVDNTQTRMIFAADARGFLWGAPVAFKYQIPLHVVRKKGKMPGDLISREYQLEYGTDTLEIAKIDKPIGTVMVVDDVLATGGTAEAICKLLHEGIGIEYKNIIVATLLNISFLPGKKTLTDLGVQVANLIDIND